MPTARLWPGVDALGVSFPVFAEDSVTLIPSEGIDVTLVQEMVDRHGAMVGPYVLPRYYRDLCMAGRLRTNDPLSLSGDAISVAPVSRVAVSVIGRRSVLEYGAIADGATDNWQAFRAAIAADVPLLFPPGDYLVRVPTAYLDDAVNGHGLNVRSRPLVDWEGPGATITIADDVSFIGRTIGLVLFDCQNVNIRGLTIDGNRDGRGGGGDYGTPCVQIYGGSGIELRDIKVINSCQDGLDVAAINPGVLATYPHDLRFVNVVAENAVRSGISLMSGYDILLDGCKGNGTNGALPGTGIHIEPNSGDVHGVWNVRYVNVDANDNEGEGFMLTGSSPIATFVSGTGNGTVTGLSAYGECEGGTYTLICTATAAHGGTFRLTAPSGAQSGSLVMAAGAGVTTRFRALGLQFDVTDGSIDFGVGARFNITGAASCARNITLDNCRGKNNAKGFLYCGAVTGVKGSYEVVGDSTAITNLAYVYVSEVSHRVQFNGQTFADITAAGSDRYLVYFDDSGSGHSIRVVRANDCSCRGLVLRDMDAADLVFDGMSASDPIVTMLGDGKLSGMIVRRSAGVGVLMASANAVVEDVAGYNPQNYLIRAFTAGATIRGVSAYVNGNAPSTALIYCDDAATPKLIEDLVANATGTPYAAADVIRFPTSKAFTLRRSKPNPLSASVTWNPAAIAPGSADSVIVTVPNVVVDDDVVSTHNTNLAGLTSRAVVLSDNTVFVQLVNNTGGVLDVGSHVVTVNGEKK